MRKKRRLLLFFIPLILLLIWGIAHAMQDYSQIQVSSVLNYPLKIYYGDQFQSLTGDLSASGVPGNESERPAFLDRWQATFTENIKSGVSYPLDKYDVYNIEETQAGDDFYKREGYPLLPYDSTIIKSFLSSYVNATSNQQDQIWNTVKNYKGNFNAYGYYQLDGADYYLIPQLVAMAGGKWDHNTGESQDLSDMSQIKGTAIYYLSPPPEITSATIVGNQLQVNFTAYGYSNRDVQVEVTGGPGKSKTYTYYNVSDTTFQKLFAKDVSDFSSVTGFSNLKVIIHDGFYRDVEALVSPPQPNLIANDIWYSPVLVQAGAQVKTSVNITNQGLTDITTDLVEKLDGKWISTQTITIPVGSSQRFNGATFTAPNKAKVNLAFEVNQTHTNPNNETVWSDNEASVDIPIQEQNLYIHFRNLPSSVGWYDTVPVEVVVGNQGGASVNASISVTDQYRNSWKECIKTVTDSEGGEHCVLWQWHTDNTSQVDNRSVTIPAHDEITYIVNMPAGWDYFDQGQGEYSIHLHGEISGSAPETTYDDNVVDADVHVNALEPPKTRVRLYE